MILQIIFKKIQKCVPRRGTDASPMMLRMIVLFSYKTVTIADTKQLFRSLTSFDISIHFVRCKHSFRSI